MKGLGAFWSQNRFALRKRSLKFSSWCSLYYNLLARPLEHTGQNGWEERKESGWGGENTENNNNRRKNNKKAISPRPLPHKKHNSDDMFISGCCACMCDCKSVMHCVVGLVRHRRMNTISHGHTLSRGTHSNDYLLINECVEFLNSWLVQIVPSRETFTIFKLEWMVYPGLPEETHYILFP